MPVTPIKSLADFRAIINSGKPVAIDFWATWCGPCRAISPVFEQHSNTNDKVEFYKVDVDEQGEIAQEVGIRAMPTFVLYQNGQKLKESIGADAGKLQELVLEGASLV